MMKKMMTSYFFFSPEYGYAKDEEDCDEDNNL